MEETQRCKSNALVSAAGSGATSEEFAGWQHRGYAAIELPLAGVHRFNTQGEVNFR